ncbi:uncharacterized protein LOC133732348 [Rosa rugosa]|uniref:uncharacterized protein LOC133732348 n=1 Tax=Rosa rugosa TaxID=74645 RepID=UPI002B40D7E1|nr:uncharacterized protein LOC133732348 [Rosa rugosa]
MGLKLILIVFDTFWQGRSSRRNPLIRVLLSAKASIGVQKSILFSLVCYLLLIDKTKVEMVVTQGDEEGKKIAAMVRQIGASKFVLGLHDHSFLYKLAMAQGNNTANNFMNCRVLAIKQPSSSPLRINKASAPSDQKVFST